MENVVEALKIAFAVMMFCLALTLSISSFTEIRVVASSIIEEKDRETEYTYVQPTKNLTRTVGVETIVPTIYEAYIENIAIEFYDKDGSPLLLYYETDNNGKRKQDENRKDIEVNYVDFERSNYETSQEFIDHLDILMADSNGYEGIYKEQIKYQNGLYDYLSQFQFEENLGEYYQGTGAAKIKKRVITYTKK